MTLSEFTQWLKGFMEGCGSNMTPDQQRTIFNKLAEVESTQSIKFTYPPYLPWYSTATFGYIKTEDVATGKGTDSGIHYQHWNECASGRFTAGTYSISDNVSIKLDTNNGDTAV